MIEAFEQLSVRPEVLMCDGQGIAHPRRLGLASHLGLWLEHPHDRLRQVAPLRQARGARPGARRPVDPMTDGEEIGAVLPTDRVKPLFVSPGHLCDLEGAIAAVLASTRGYRLPMTTRMAHQYVNELRQQGSADLVPSRGLYQRCDTASRHRDRHFTQVDRFAGLDGEVSAGYTAVGSPER